MTGVRKTTWFCVADGSRALIYESNGRSDWRLIAQLDGAEARKPDRALGRDQPPRGQASVGARRYSFDEGSLHDRAETSFLDALAGHLNAGAAQKQFAQLVIAAPGRALTKLRDGLAPTATASVLKFVQKDLVKTQPAELRSYFSESLVGW